MNKPMVKYNRALDWMALAMNELTANKNPVLAARLMAKAAQEPDVKAAIATIEATNRVAHQNMVKAARLRASAEMTEDESEFPVESEEGAETVASEDEFEGDPLDDIEDEEEPAAAPIAAGRAMAKVLSSMTRKTTTGLRRR